MQNHKMKYKAKVVLTGAHKNRASENTRITWVSLMLLSLALFLYIASMTAANAANIQSSEALRQIALNFLQQKTALQQKQESEISIGRIDRRLRLTECSTPPTAFLSPGSKPQGKISVGLRCTGEKPWMVYIPAQIKSYANVISTAHSLPRGTRISAADVMTVRQDIGELRGDYFTENKAIIGMILKKSMSAGQVIVARNVKPPLLVHRGDDVTILASTGGLTVRVKGKALQDAALGERVPVRNKQSKRVVQGTAVKYGVVSVQM